jgi:SAM-dependent methyltransferase
MTDTTQSAQPGLERYGDRLFSSARIDEFRRLDSLARAFNPASEAHLSALNLSPSARCLDVGAGTGDVARALTRLVPDGEVVALDRDTVFLDELADDRLTVLEGDLTDADFDPGQFDLVHSRFVLMHLRDREALLERLVRWVRPGGWLILSDSVDFGGIYSSNPAYRATLLGLYRAILDTIGSDVNFGRRYPRALQELGLVDIGVAADLPHVYANGPLAEFWTLTLSQAKPRIVATGLASEEQFDECLRYLDTPGNWDFSLGMVTAWGRRA